MDASLFGQVFSMEKKDNIFETAAKSGKKKATPKLQTHKKSTKVSHQDPEIQEMLDKIEFMKEDLRTRLDEIHRKTGLSKEILEGMISIPGNFFPATIEKLHKDYDTLRDRAFKAVGKDKTQTKKRGNISGERKAKSLGARKKWIPMR
jgi:hypothetical protein